MTREPATATPTKAYDLSPQNSSRLGAAYRLAKCTLNAGHCRINLCVGLLIAITLGFCALAATDCLYYVIYLVGEERTVWVGVLQSLLIDAIALFVFLPLTVSVYRMAVLSLLRNRAADGELPVSECLYPFTSFRAYLRTMCVGLEVLGWIALVLLVPIGAFVLLWYHVLVPLQETLLPAWWMLSVCGCGMGSVALAVGFLVLSCLRAGVAYTLFAHEDLSLGAAYRYARGYVRPTRTILWLRLATYARLLLGALPIFLPLFAHTVPYAMLTDAAFVGTMERRWESSAESAPMLYHMNQSGGSNLEP